LSKDHKVLVLAVPDKTHYEYCKSKWPEEILARDPIVIWRPKQLWDLEKHHVKVIRFIGFAMWKYAADVTAYLFQRFSNYDVYDEFLEGPHIRKRSTHV
jgi:hypothetical protein